MSKLPESVLDIVHEIIENLKIISNRGQNMTFVNDRQNNIIRFSCFTNLELLVKSEIWFIDGTFKSAPTFFLSNVHNTNY